MWITVLAHIGSLAAAVAAGWIVWLTVGLFNTGIAAILNMLATPILLRFGNSPESVQRLHSFSYACMFLITGVLEGLIVVAISLLVFHKLGRAPGIVMVVLFIALEFLKPRPSVSRRDAQRAWIGTLGTVAGLLLGWWYMYPSNG